VLPSRSLVSSFVVAGQTRHQLLLVAVSRIGNEVGSAAQRRADMEAVLRL
jgi:hypothetical protein